MLVTQSIKSYARFNRMAYVLEKHFTGNFDEAIGLAQMINLVI